MASNSPGWLKPDWFKNVNYIRRKRQNADSLPEAVRNTLDSPGFKQWAMKLASHDATREGMVVFIGSGDLASQIMREIKDNNSHVVTVGIDSKIAVGCSDADYFLWLNDEQERLRNDAALIKILQGLLARRSRASTGFRKQVAGFLHQGFVPLRLAPMLIGDYHGFKVKTVFEAAESLGYQVMPDKDTALRAMDKVEFWQAYHTDPTFSNYLLPQEVVEIPEELFSGKVAPLQFMEEAEQKVRSIGLPCMLKPAISEFGYGQVKLEDTADIAAAFKAVAEQCDARKVNPGNRIVIEPFADRKVVESFAKGRPIELLLTVVRHRNGDGRLVSTCLQPIWFVNHPPRPYQNSKLVAGPQVFDFAIQASEDQLPNLLSTDEYGEIRQKSIELVERMTKAPGLFGLEVFILSSSNGKFEYKFNRLSVRTQDTMLATIPTQRINAFALLANLMQGDRIDADLLTQMYSGGVKTIVWEGDGRDKKEKIVDIEGEKEARRVRHVKDIIIHREMWDVLRPLRRYGMIYIQAPLHTPVEEVMAVMEEARACITIVPESRDRNQ